MVPVPGRAAAALAAYFKDVRPRLVVDPHEGAPFLTAWWGHRLSDVSVSFLPRRHTKTAGTCSGAAPTCATSRPSSATGSSSPPAPTPAS
jgi:hypothetical protein